jgi:hypothetical protein
MKSDSSPVRDSIARKEGRILRRDFVDARKLPVSFICAAKLIQLVEVRGEETFARKSFAPQNDTLCSRPPRETAALCTEAQGFGHKFQLLRILLFCVGAAEVGAVLFVLFAGVGHDLGILALDGERDGPWFGVKLGILEGHGPFDIVFVDLLKALDQMQLIAVLMAGGIEPSAIVQADRIDDQRVAIPVADGISEPGGVQIFGMAAAIGVDDSEGALILEEDSHHRRRLHDLERHDAGLDSSRRADRQALRERIIDLVFFLEKIGSIRRKRRLMAEGLGNVRRKGRGPDAVQIRRSGGLSAARAPTRASG